MNLRSFSFSDSIVAITNRTMIIVFIIILLLMNYSKSTIKQHCPWLPRSKGDKSVYNSSKLIHCRGLGPKYSKQGRQARVVFGVPPKAFDGGLLSKSDLRHLAKQSASIGRFLFVKNRNGTYTEIIQEFRVASHDKSDILPATVVASAESIFYGMNEAKILIVLDMGQLCSRDQFCKTKVKNLRQQNQILVFFVNYEQAQNSFDDFEFIKSFDLQDNVRFNRMLANCICKILDDGGHLVKRSTPSLTNVTGTTRKLRTSMAPDGHVIIFPVDAEGTPVSRSPLFLILILCCSIGAVLTILIAVLILYTCREKRRRQRFYEPKSHKSKTDSLLNEDAAASESPHRHKNRKAKSPATPPKALVVKKEIGPRKSNSDDRRYLKSSECSPAPTRDQSGAKEVKKDAAGGRGAKSPAAKKMQNYEVLLPQSKLVK